MYHKTKEGKKILISEMDDNHLLNTIALIKRMAKEGITFRSGSINFGYNDCYYDEEILFGKDAKEHLNYKRYKQEAKKRGLIRCYK